MTGNARHHRNTRERSRLLTLCLLVAAASLLSVPDSDAAEDTSERERARPQLEEVLVTARRREESLQQTPVSISALTDEDLKEAGITTIADIKRLASNLQFSQSGQKSPAIFIRGIGQRAPDINLDPGVGMYLNGVYIARQDTQLLDAVDVQSIQVLRGPQGTLFGKNNIGGAILVNSKKPDMENFELGATLTAGSHGRRNARINTNLPLADNLGLRAAVIAKKLDGWFENDFGNKTYGDEDRKAATARLLWDITDSWAMDLFGFYSTIDELGAARNCLVQDPTAFLTAAVIRGGFDNSYIVACRFAERSAEKGHVAIDDDTFYALDNLVLGLSFIGRVGPAHIESITAWSRQDNIHIHSEQDGTPLKVFGNGNGSTGRAKNDIIASGFEYDPEVRTQFSQELKANLSLLDQRLQWTLGLFYSVERLDNALDAQDIGDHGLIAVDSAFLAGGSGGDPEVVPLVAGNRIFSNLENEAWAVFSQASYNITDWLEFTLGARLTRETRQRDVRALNIDFQEYANRLNAQIGSDPNILVPIAPSGIEPLFTPIPREQYLAYRAPDVPYGSATIAENEADFSELTPSATLSFLPRREWIEPYGFDSLMTYVTFSKGFKAGGFDIRGDELSRFDPEFVKNYEIGFKLDAFDRRLRLNAAAYHLDYDDIQVQLSEQGEGIVDILVFLTNAGEAVVDGFEIEATALLGALTISTGIGYADADFTEYTLATGTRDGVRNIDRSDEAFPLVPQNTRNVVIQYDWMTPVGLIVPRFHYYYRDEIFVGLDFAADNFETSTLPQQEIYNFRLSWVPSEKLQLSAFVNNARDAIYNEGGFIAVDAVGAANFVPAPPRHYGLSLNLQF